MAPKAKKTKAQLEEEKSKSSQKTNRYEQD